MQFDDIEERFWQYQNEAQKQKNWAEQLQCEGRLQAAKEAKAFAEDFETCVVDMEELIAKFTNSFLHRFPAI